MGVYLIAGLLLAVQGASCGATSECSASRAINFNLSVASRRNLTGHWTVSVAAASEDPTQFSQRNATRDIVVDVGHSTTSCHGSKTVHMTASAQVNGPVPPAGYEVVNGLGYYKMYTTPLKWLQARDQCERDGAHLIILNSDREASVVQELFARNPNPGNYTNYDHVHSGFHDRYTKGQYVTVLGEPLADSGYTKWGLRQPTGISTENCGTIYMDTTLFDTNCASHALFICEYNAY